MGKHRRNSLKVGVRQKSVDIDTMIEDGRAALEKPAAQDKDVRNALYNLEYLSPSLSLRPEGREVWFKAGIDVDYHSGHPVQRYTKRGQFKDGYIVERL